MVWSLCQPVSATCWIKCEPGYGQEYTSSATCYQFYKLKFIHLYAHNYVQMVPLGKLLTYGILFCHTTSYTLVQISINWSNIFEQMTLCLLHFWILWVSGKKAVLIMLRYYSNLHKNFENWFYNCDLHVNVWKKLFMINNSSF